MFKPFIDFRGKIMNYIAAVRAVLSLYPLLIDLITMVEALIPEKGMGSDKLVLVKEYLADVFPSLEGFTDSLEEYWPLIEKLISFIVTIKNRFGW